MPVKQCHRFLCGIVGKAQNGDVGALEEILPHRPVAPLGLGDRDDVKIMTLAKPRSDLKTRRPMFAVDEDFWFQKPVLSVQVRIYGLTRLEARSPSTCMATVAPAMAVTSAWS
jgi:hypothetical protein